LRHTVYKFYSQIAVMRLELILLPIKGGFIATSRCYIMTLRKNINGVNFLIAINSLTG